MKHPVILIGYIWRGDGGHSGPDKGPLKYHAVGWRVGGRQKYDIVLHGGWGRLVGQNMIFNDMGWRPDMIWYITTLVALLAGIDGEPLHEDLNCLFRLSEEKQKVDYVFVSLAVLDNISASDWWKVGDVARCR